MEQPAREKPPITRRSAVLHARPEYERLGKWLRSVREAAGLEQKPVSRAIGKPAQFLNKVEQGKQRIDVVEFVDLLRALNYVGDVAVNDLFEVLGPDFPNG